jgi:diguanylate cyclase (GGDEF)-like protein/PAS domain S-box-containing protein
VVFDREGKVLYANRQARADLLHLDETLPADGLFAYDLELVDSDGAPLQVVDLPSVRTLRTGEVIQNFVMGARFPGGPMNWVLVGTAPVRQSGDGSITGVVCTFSQVTAQRRAEDASRASEERFRLLAENAADVIYRINVGPSPSFDYLNAAVEPVLGYKPEEFYENRDLIVAAVHADDLERVRELGFSGVPDVDTVELRMIRRDGTVIWTEHRIVPIHDGRGAVTAIEGIARDVTELKLKEALLSHRALHDPLTGLPNRVLLLDRLEGALARIRRHQSFLAVLYLDLDRFKTVNDNLGHEIGDVLLGVVAGRLQETLRPTDSVARLGGDEFAAILPDLNDAREAEQIAERLLAAVSAPVDLGEGGIVTTVSIGIAAAGDGDTSAAELLRRADFAMYTAKDRGRARIQSYDALVSADRPAHESGGSAAS